MVRTPPLAGLAAAFLFAAPVLAQSPEGGTAAQIRAMYRAHTLARVNEILTRWDEAWLAGDADLAADTYAVDAVLILPGAIPVVGRESVRARLGRHIREMAGLVNVPLDFDASGGMAVMYSQYSFFEGGEPRRGSLVTVYQERNRTWEIRTQIFREYGPADRSSVSRR